MRLRSKLPVLLAFMLCSSAFAQPGSYYPPPSAVTFHGDTLTICPPDSLPGDPVELISYNIFVDGEFYDSQPVADPADTSDYFFDITTVTPGDRSFCVKAVYNEWISESTCDTAQVFYGMALPVLEDWSSGSFETLQWTTDSENWIINVDEGNPAPSAAFLGDPAVTDYEIALESFPMTAVGMTNGKIWLYFDIKLDANQSTGTELLSVQLWNWVSQTWTTWALYDNSEGSFGWSTEHINIKTPAMNKVFKVRFLATGENSAGINSWKLDNIHIYRTCDGIWDVWLEENLEYNNLEWDGLGGIWFDEWLNWDDGVFSGTSIGLGEPAEFEFAARWEPDQLAYLPEPVITEVAFVPAEENADYRIRIRNGSGPDSLLVDQPVQSPVIGQWNYVSLDDTMPIDVTKDLWVGYYVNAQTGYPGGVDDGPAIDGFGNMVYYQDQWQTLKDLNPDLDYNWNIACHVIPGPPFPNDKWFYKIYRNTDGGDYQLLDTTFSWNYEDHSIILEEKYCYRVSVVWTENQDSCESDLSSEVCETLCLGINDSDQEIAVKIYPNPAASQLFIESQDEIRQVTLYNSQGEEVMKLEIGNLQCRLDIQDLPSGIYLIEVKTITRVYRSKVLITQ